MTHEIISIFIARLSALLRFVDDQKSDKARIKAEIFKLMQWVANDPALKEMRMFHAFVTYLYQSHGDEYENREDFYDDLKRQVGHCKIKTTEATIAGERVIFKKYKPLSLSFGDCSQVTRHDVIQRVKELAITKWGINLDEWKREYDSAENLLQ